MPAIQVGPLEIVVSESGPALRAAWAGEADERDPRRTVLPFLDALKDQAAQQGKEVILDFTNLHFMNSSCIGLVISFVKSLQQARVKASVRYDTRHEWQTLSLKCTRTIFARSEGVSVIDTASDVLPR